VTTQYLRILHLPDLHTDPDQLHNIASKPERARTLSKLRAKPASALRASKTLTS